MLAISEWALVFCHAGLRELAKTELLRIICQFLRNRISVELNYGLALFVADSGPLSCDNQLTLLIQGARVFAAMVLLALRCVELSLRLIGSAGAFLTCALIEIFRSLGQQANMS